MDANQGDAAGGAEAISAGCARLTAVARARRALERLDAGPLNGADWAGGRTAFALHVAADPALRSRAYRLAYEMYLAKGYVSPRADGLLFAPYDMAPHTFTLLAVDPDVGDAGTVTLVFDRRATLPCEEVFGEEVAALSRSGHRMAEVTRLAIRDDYPLSKELLVALFNSIYIHARRGMGCSDFLIEVNPRHVNYYRRLLFFEPLSAEKPCPRVNGAPAVLLKLDLELGAAAVREMVGAPSVQRARCLYPHFRPYGEEAVIARRLAGAYRPMSAAERACFLAAARSEREAIPRSRHDLESLFDEVGIFGDLSNEVFAY